MLSINAPVSRELSASVLAAAANSSPDFRSAGVISRSASFTIRSSAVLKAARPLSSLLAIGRILAEPVLTVGVGNAGHAMRRVFDGQAERRHAAHVVVEGDKLQDGVL